MAVKWFSGVEWGSVTTGVEFSLGSGSPTISTTTKHTGARSLRVNNTTIYTFKGINHTFNATNLNLVYAQFWIYITTSTDAQSSCFTLYDTTGTMTVSMQLTTDDKLSLWYNDSATQVGSNSAALSKNTWYCVEVKLDKSGSAGTHIVEARIDGSVFATVSNATVTYGANQFGIGMELNGDGATTMDVFFDDFEVNDSEYPNLSRTVIALPTGAGDNAATTGIYSYINEIPPSGTATSGSTMVELDSNGVIADYAMTDSSTMGIDSYDVIKAVSVLARIREEAAGTSSYQLRIKSASGGTVTSTTAADAGNATARTNPSSTTAFGKPLLSLTDPTTGVAWTPTGTNSIDNMQVGLTNVDADSTPDLWCLTLCAMVLYRDTTITTKTITGVARIQTVVSQTITGKANITTGSTTTPQTITGKARITKVVAQTLTGKARITDSEQRTITGKARITKVVPQTVQGRARITKTVAQTASGRARITKTVGQTTTGKARIGLVTQRDITGKASILVVTTTPQTIQGRARITDTLQSTITGKASIQTTTSRTLAGTGRISLVTQRSIQGVSRIIDVVAQTLQGKANIFGTTVRTIAGVAAIITIKDRTILGTARIQKTVGAIVQGTARVGLVTAKTVTGLARITQVTLSAITGKARITDTALQTLQGRARIELVTAQTINGVAKIVLTWNRTITGKANIVGDTLRTITGKASIRSNWHNTANETGDWTRKENVSGEWTRAGNTDGTWVRQGNSTGEWTRTPNEEGTWVKKDNS